MEEAVIIIQYILKNTLIKDCNSHSIKDCNSHSICDFTEMDSLVIIKIDSEKVVLAGKKVSNEYFDEWILLEIEEKIIDNKEDDDWPNTF